MALDDTSDWRAMLAEPQGRATSKSKYDRMSFIGDTLAETLAVRNGFDRVNQDGTFYSLCITCNCAINRAAWGDQCGPCKGDTRDDQNREQVRLRVGSTGSYPSGHVNL